MDQLQKSQIKKICSDIDYHKQLYIIYLKRLKKDIEYLNQDCWYGGNSAKKWYMEIDNEFRKMVQFACQIDEIQNYLYKELDKITVQ